MTAHPEDTIPEEEEEELFVEKERNNNTASVSPTYSLDDDEEDEEDDEDTELRAAAFQRQRNKQQNNVSVHRFDEYTDYLVRSERSVRLSALVHQEPPAPLSKVSFATTLSQLFVVHELEPLDKNAAASLYMTADNWSAIDLDVELTQKRWKNHLDGSIPFDTTKNTIRGLEYIIEPEKNTTRNAAMRDHRQAVLHEQVQQKNTGEWYNVEKLQSVSLHISKPWQTAATQQGQVDHQDALTAWEAPQEAKETTTTTTSHKKETTAAAKKKKGGLFGLFHHKKK